MACLELGWFPKSLAIMRFQRSWLGLCGHWRNLRIGPLIGAFLAIATLSLLDAWRHQRSYNQEPQRFFEPVASQRGSIYAASPAVSRAGVVFESMGAGGYTLNRKWAFEGHAFHPSVPASGSPTFSVRLPTTLENMSSTWREHQRAAFTKWMPDPTAPALAIGDRIYFQKTVKR